jgi:hypothetical protein
MLFPFKRGYRMKRWKSQRIRAAIAALVVIGCGLALRKFGYPVHLPFVVVKYGGSCLWGAMVYFLLASLSGKTKAFNLAIGAFAIALAVELFRLFHTPWLDAFRVTTAGALLIGRVFSFWNILFYALGILAAFVIDRRHLSRAARPG